MSALQYLLLAAFLLGLAQGALSKTRAPAITKAPTKAPVTKIPLPTKPDLNSLSCYDPTKAFKNRNTVFQIKDQSTFRGCLDDNGARYTKGSTLPNQCCNCLEYICTYVPKTVIETYRWEVYRVEKGCCADCEGKVYPANTVMNTTVLNDECGTTQTTTCRFKKDAKPSLLGTVASEIVEEFSMSKCCYDNNGITHVNSTDTVLEPATCSYRKCQAHDTVFTKSYTTDAYGEAYWNSIQVYEGCDCCMYNGSLIPEGGWTVLADGSNATCCDGNLVVETLSNCRIEAFAYQLDTSGSMGSSAVIWKPVATRLIDEMVAKHVRIDEYHLFSYVDKISDILSTDQPNLLRSTVESWNTYSGSRELTFAGLIHALNFVKTNAFICVWTDEIGDDTSNSTLKAEILSLKASTQSEIFIMAVNAHPKLLYAFNVAFKGIGQVMDVTNDPDVVDKTIEHMKNSTICK